MILLFDFDGTLHNTKRLYGEAFRKAYAWLTENGYAPDRHYSDEDVSCYLGVSAPDMWHSFMPDLPPEIMQKASSMIGREMIDGVLAGKAVFYDGITQALDALKAAGFRMMILSNCRHSYMEAHRRMLKLDRWFEDYFCAEDYDFIPKEDVFLRISHRYPGESFIMIGDRASDLQVGIVHRLPFVGCLYGFGSPDELHSASLLVRSPSELPSAIASLT